MTGQNAVGEASREGHIPGEISELSSDDDQCSGASESDHAAEFRFLMVEILHGCNRRRATMRCGPRAGRCIAGRNDLCPALATRFHTQAGSKYDAVGGVDWLAVWGQKRDLLAPLDSYVPNCDTRRVKIDGWRRLRQQTLVRGTARESIGRPPSGPGEPFSGHRAAGAWKDDACVRPLYTYLVT